MTASEGLLDQGAAVLAAVESYIKRSEDRAAYRREHGRALSAQHKAQLAALVARLDGLRERLTAILEPAPTGEELRRAFEAACARLAGLESEHDHR